MSNQNTPEKLQTPLKDKDGFFYPLTTFDQIIMPDGVSRWDGSVPDHNNVKTINNKTPDSRGKITITAKDVGALSVDADGKILNGNNPVPINADTFNGMTYEQLKQALMHEAVYQ